MIVTAAVKFVLTLSLAAPGESPGKGIDPNTAYDPLTAASVHCKIEEVYIIKWPLEGGATEGMCLQVKNKSNNTVYTVIVAPIWHVGSYINFKPGDFITVLGSMKYSRKKRVLVARWIKKEGRTLHLRSAEGIPHWQYSGPVMRNRTKGTKRRGKGSRGGGGRAPGM